MRRETESKKIVPTFVLNPFCMMYCVSVIVLLCVITFCTKKIKFKPKEYSVHIGIKL